jgi:MFS family permease
MNSIIAEREVPSTRNIKLVVAAATIGNALEFFDFTVYGFFAVLIGQLFFPNMSSYGQILASVSTFGVGFVMRPVGGIVIGAYADRVSRKAAVSLTIFLMGLGCAMIACAPTYSQIGLFAPVLLVTARLLQGFSAGGEVGASTTLLIEKASAKNRGFYGSWQFASQGLGIAVGSAVSALLSILLTQSELREWGWRIPFLLGVVITPVGVIIRQLLGPMEAPGSRSQVPFIVVLRRQWTSVVLGILLTIGATVTAYVVTFYMPTYAIRELGVGAPVSLLAALISGLAIFAISPVAGLLSDRIGRKKLVFWPRLMICVLVYPSFVWITSAPGAASLLVSVGVLSALLALQGAPAITMLPEMFPMQIRATGVAIVYSIGVAIFGGFAQTVALWLVHTTGNKLAPAYYLIACVFVSCLSLPFITERARVEIDT